jgi:hypothetical protein
VASSKAKVAGLDGHHFTVVREYHFQMDAKDGGASGAVLIFVRGEWIDVFANQLGQWSAVGGLALVERHLSPEFSEPTFGLLPGEERLLAEAAAEFARKNKSK